jgi:glutathione S-transferase
MWTWIFVIGIGIVAYIFRAKSRQRNAKGLLQPNYKRDVVYLVQFPVSPHIRSISPFSLKLETYLRMKGVTYENVYTLKFSKKGQIPFIELNGEQIPDSNVAIKELEARGLAKKDEGNTTQQQSIGHLATVALENHTAIAGFYWRYGFHMEEFFVKLVQPFFGGGKAGLLFFRYLQPFMMRLKTRMHGLGRHSTQEVAEFACEDLKALSLLLDEKPFFAGDNPSTVDCTLFGHLVQFVYLPMAIPQKNFIQTECGNLVLFVDRMRTNFWPDWQEMCHGKCMEGRRLPLS